MTFLKTVRCRKHQVGYTLIELLVVLSIIGLLVGVVVLNFTDQGEVRRLNTHAERLMLQVELARQRSTSTNEILGLAFGPNSYGFTRLAANGTWVAIADSAFGNSELPTNFRLDAELIDGGQSSKVTKNEQVPDVLIYPGGQMSPFQANLRLVSSGQELFVFSDGIQRVFVSATRYEPKVKD